MDWTTFRDATTIAEETQALRSAGLQDANGNWVENVDWDKAEEVLHNLKVSKLTLPTEFCSLHKQAKDSLTSQWQDFKSLHQTTGLDINAYDDLRWWGLAEEKREPIIKHGQHAGERIYLRAI